jgi:cytochrome c oxidase subunit I+III
MNGLQTSSTTLKRWLYTTNHKDVGILYIVTSLLFFFIAGSLALTIRTQLATPENTVLTATVYNEFVTVHGLLMILWVLSPLAIGLANYFIPLMIGARDLAFPRLNGMSYWLYLFGGIGMILSFFLGGPDTGWTLYSPQTACSDPLCASAGLNIAVGALALLVASITIGSVNFIVTMFKMRAPGLKLSRMSMFPWAMLVTIFMMLYAFPSLLAGLIILFANRTFPGGLASYLTLPGNIQNGNVPSLLWDDVFWFFGHPEVYIVLFPAVGVIGEILPTFTRRPLYGAKYVTMSIIAAAVISFIVWGHHMFVTGVSPLTTQLFTLTTIAVSLPFDVITISMIETLFHARIRLKTPVLFAIGAICLFIIGGITGVFLASIALDTQLRGTYFVVAHFHYIMVGAGIMGLIGGLYYWFPKISGRMYNERLGKIHFILSFIGINVLYFPMFFLLDMPRRIVTYTPDTGWGSLNSLATIGGFIFGLSQILLLANLGQSVRKGPLAGPNPWQGSTLEWSTPSPPPLLNFEEIPRVSPDGTVNFGTKAAAGVPNGHGHAKGHLSKWPIVIAAAAFLFFLGLTVAPPPPNLLLTIPGVVVGIVGLYGYGNEKFVVREDEETDRGLFEKIPRVRLGVWAFLASEIIFFGVLLGAYMFVRVNSATWPPFNTFDVQRGATNTFILLTSSLTAVMALVAAKAGSKTGLLASLSLTFALGATFLVNKAAEWAELASAPTRIFTNYPLAATSYYITTGVHGVHVVAGLIMVAYLVAKTLKGNYLNGDHEAVHHFGLYWHFVDIVWIFLFPLFYLI